MPFNMYCFPSANKTLFVLFILFTSKDNHPYDPNNALLPKQAFTQLSKCFGYGAAFQQNPCFILPFIFLLKRVRFFQSPLVYVLQLF